MDKYTQEARDNLREGLQRIKEHVLAAKEGTIDKLPWDEELGICWAVRSHTQLPVKISLLLDTFEACPSFSGIRMYPVKHPDKDPGTAFTFTYGPGMWREGEYADNRLQLLNEAIDVLTNNINTDQIPAGITKETL